MGWAYKLMGSRAERPVRAQAYELTKARAYRLTPLQPCPAASSRRRAVMSLRRHHSTSL